MSTKRTFQGSKTKRRKLGFRTKMSTTKGAKVISKRRAHGRTRLAV